MGGCALRNPGPLPGLVAKRHNARRLRGLRSCGAVLLRGLIYLLRTARVLLGPRLNTIGIRSLVSFAGRVLVSLRLW